MNAADSEAELPIPVDEALGHSTLRELIKTVTPEPLQALVAEDLDRAVTEVVITDPAAADAKAGQVLLGVGAEKADALALLRRAGAVHVGAVVIRTAAGEAEAELAEVARQAGVALLTFRPELSWSRVFVLLRAVVAGSPAGGTSEGSRLVPGDLFGLAEAIAAMVGGSAVLYDPSQRVLSYAVGDNELDNVRLETILGRRTPLQWAKRFADDNSPWRGAVDPGKVVRIDGYAEVMTTRLRIAVHSGGELLGEISIAEGGQRLGKEAEEALQRAAELAVPHFIRYRIAQSSEREIRWGMLRAILAGTGPTELHAQQLGINPSGSFTVVGFHTTDLQAGDGLDSARADERVLQFLSLRLTGFNPRSAVLYDDLHLGLVPTVDDSSRLRLIDAVNEIVAELQGFGLTARAAVGSRSKSLYSVVDSHREVRRLVELLDRGGGGPVLTSDLHWLHLFLFEVEEMADSLDWSPAPPLQKLIEEDEKGQTEYIKTLRAFLDAMGSTSAASNALVLHPNTFRHRVRRIVEVSGVDLDDPLQRLALDLQLRLRDRRGADR